MPRVLVVLGVLLVLVGLLWAAFPRALSWFGHLPGDIRIEGAHGSVFIPLASMLVVSVAGSLVLNAAAWILRRWG